jgi:hypothetical protein
VTTLDRGRLRALELPLEELPTQDLVWQLTGGRGGSCLPRLDDAPIHVTIHEGRWVVLDGVERLLRAVALERPTVSVHKVPTWALPLILVAS